MDDDNRLKDIRRRIEETSGTGGVEGGKNAREDIIFLLDLLKKTTDLTEKLKKKNDILSRQNLELTQEIENVKGDFGESVR